MKILVFMSDNRPLTEDIQLADYNSLVACINYAYCKKHNYDFTYYLPYLNFKNSRSLYNCIDPHRKAVRHAAWSKLLSTKKALDLDYEYVVYIDTDCIFKDFNKRLESIIEAYPQNDTIFFNNKPHPNPESPCSGFYICKVNDSTKQFIYDWYNLNLQEFNTKHSWEQEALRYIYKKYNLVIVDAWMFVEEDGQFLRHISHIENENRIPYFRNFITNNNIEFNTSLINIINYNTNNDTLSIVDKKFKWNNGSITFKNDGILEGFDKGHYYQLDKNTVLADFGSKTHLLVFSKELTKFIAICKNNRTIARGELIPTTYA